MKLVINTGRPAAVVARELGVKDQTLGRWANLFTSRLAFAIIGGVCSYHSRWAC